MAETPEKKTGPKATAASAFLALKPDITAALEAGVKRRTFYEEHREALGTSYVQFTRYVARHITGKEPPKPKGTMHAPASRCLSDCDQQTPAENALGAAGVDVADPSRASTPRRAGPIVTPARETKKFKFDPTRAHGREDELF